MKRDLEEYLISVQKQRDEMLKAVEEANKLILEGKLEQSQVEAIQNYFNILETNYQRVLYCRYLYNLPPKLIQKLRRKREEIKLKKFIDTNSDAASVIEENNECIEKVKDSLHNDE